MEEKLLESLLKRPGMTDKREVLKDIVQDCIQEMCSYLNYREGEPLPQGCIPALKELALIKFNRDGTEGIQSESQSSGGSVTYMDGLPSNIRRQIRRYRRLPR